MDAANIILQLSQVQVRSSADDAFIMEVDDFKIYNGERIGIKGDSGSGKTTLLKVLSGGIFFDTSYKVFGQCLFIPKSGSPLELDQLTTIHDRQQKKIPIAFVPQEPMASFSLVHKVGPQLEDISSVLPTDEALRLAGLDSEIKDRYPRELSLGQMQRVAIASALRMGAELILMDEPTASLDFLQKQNLLHMLKQLNANQGVSFVIVSHQSDFIDAFCSVVYKMESGFLLKQDEPHFLPASFIEHESTDIRPSEAIPFLEIQDLSFQYNSKQKSILHRINFEFSKGGKYGITGVSGCGKSTLGRLIAGLETPTEGFIKFQGKKVSDHSIKEWIQRKRSIQFLWQDALMAMNPAFKSGKILQFAYDDQKSWKKDLTPGYMKRLLQHCGIDDAMLGLYPVQLSGGQRQRINLAKALLGKPEILIADEPFAAIDESHKSALYEVLNSIPEMKDVTLLLISHDPADLIACCENVLIMDSGKVIESGNLKKIIKNPAHPVTRQLLSASYVV